MDIMEAIGNFADKFDTISAENTIEFDEEEN